VEPIPERTAHCRSLTQLASTLHSRPSQTRAIVDHQHSNGPMEGNRGSLFSSIIQSGGLPSFYNVVLVTILGALTLLLWALPAQVRRWKAKGKPRTWRVSGLPLTAPEEDVRLSLETLSISSSSRKNESNVLQFSITKQSRTSCCATVTFRHTPSVLQKSTDEVLVTLKIVDQNVETRFDTHFQGMTVLFSPSNPTVDIVAVTGLAGHALGSWKAPRDTKVWLRDFLPKENPTARVLTYGYDTKILGSVSKSSIHDLGMAFLEALKVARSDDEVKQRPMILIGHSLGGIVIKQALVIARSGSGADPETEAFHKWEVCRASYALVFFAVPNRGMRREKALSILKRQPNQPLLESLVTDRDDEPSAILGELDAQFLKSFDFTDSPMLSYYERDETKMVKVSSHMLSQRQRSNMR
jgi:hypothetical protein